LWERPNPTNLERPERQPLFYLQQGENSFREEPAQQMRGINSSSTESRKEPTCFKDAILDWDGGRGKPKPVRSASGCERVIVTSTDILYEKKNVA